MTNFTAVESSLTDGKPVEGYRFRYYVNNKVSEEYLYTTAQTAVKIAGQTFQPIVMSRSEIKITTENDDQNEIAIEMPRDTDFVKNFAFKKLVPNLIVEVFRTHIGLNANVKGGYALLWKGPIVKFEINGNIATIKSPNVFSRTLEAQYPALNFQSQCNHILFDARCGVKRSTYAKYTKITHVNELHSVRVKRSHATLGTNGYYAGGEVVIRRGTAREERRMIVASSIFSGTETTLNITHDFESVKVGESVEIVPGCNHSYPQCRLKFKNGDRFGGLPMVPNDNPFTGTLS